MFITTEDPTGPVCINMDTGLRFRPRVERGVVAGVQLYFPDGNTNIQLRATFEALCESVNSIPAGNVKE